MSGCLGWVFFGVFILMAKAFVAIAKGIWALMMWALQVISGCPLSYCKHEYLLPAKLLGAMGLLSLTCSPLVTVHSPGGRTEGSQWLAFMAMLVIGAALVWLSRIMVRRGSQ